MPERPLRSRDVAAPKRREITLDIRCDRHVGEPFEARCYACEGLRAEYAALAVPLADL